MKLIDTKKTEKYLPIGSVVFVKDDIKKIMIIGYFAKDETQKKYDYVAIYYPEGYEKKEYLLKFNHEDIIAILKMGLIFDKQKEYNDFLNGRAEEYKF